MTFNDITKKRRSINFFDPDKKVEDDQLNQIIEMAARTPSSFNLQPWNLMILKDPAEKERLKKLAWDQPKVVEAPVVFIVLGDRNGWKEGQPFFEKNWNEMLAAGGMQEEQRDWFLDATRTLYGRNQDAQQAFAAKNAGFFAMSLMYAATDLGLETHAMDGFDHDAVKKEFNIPDHYWVPLLIAVGHKKPGLELLPPKWRKTKEDIVVTF